MGKGGRPVWLTTYPPSPPTDEPRDLLCGARRVGPSCGTGRSRVNPGAYSSVFSYVSTAIVDIDREFVDLVARIGHPGAAQVHAGHCPGVVPDMRSGMASAVTSDHTAVEPGEEIRTLFEGFNPRFLTVDSDREFLAWGGRWWHEETDPDPHTDEIEPVLIQTNIGSTAWLES